MKRFISILLALTMAFALVGCKGGQGEANPPASPPSNNSAGGSQTKQLVGVVVPKAIGSTWFDSMNWETTKWADQLKTSGRGYELENHYIGPTSMDSALQLQGLADAIALNPDIICVVPIAADAVDEQLAIAKSKGCIVTSHEGSTLKNIDYNVDAFQNKAYGEHFADKFVEYGGESGKIALTVGSLTEVSHNEWAQACYDKLTSEHPGWVSVTGGAFIESGVADNAYNVAKQIIQAYPDLTAIFIGSASASVPTARAVEELGKTGQIKLIGTCSASSVQDQWKAGILTYTSFWYPGYCAAAAYEVALRQLEGNPVKTGDDLGVYGFNSIIVEGKNVFGTGWFSVTPENYEEMAKVM